VLINASRADGAAVPITRDGATETAVRVTVDRCLSTQSSESATSLAADPASGGRPESRVGTADPSTVTAVPATTTAVPTTATAVPMTPTAAPETSVPSTTAATPSQTAPDTETGAAENIRFRGCNAVEVTGDYDEVELEVLVYQPEFDTYTVQAYTYGDESGEIVEGTTVIRLPAGYFGDQQYVETATAYTDGAPVTRANPDADSCRAALTADDDSVETAAPTTPSTPTTTPATAAPTVTETPSSTPAATATPTESGTPAQEGGVEFLDCTAVEVAGAYDEVELEVLVYQPAFDTYTVQAYTYGDEPGEAVEGTTVIRVPDGYFGDQQYVSSATTYVDGRPSTTANPDEESCRAALTADDGATVTPTATPSGTPASTPTPESTSTATPESTTSTPAKTTETAEPTPEPTSTPEPAPETASTPEPTPAPATAGASDAATATESA
jgi:hypothetical protein